MTSRDFCLWCQGYFEISEYDSGVAQHGLNAAQVRVMRNHLNLVFKHEIDPSIDGGKPEVIAALDAIHSGKPKPHNPFEDTGLIRC